MSSTPFDFDPVISPAAENRDRILQTCELSDSRVPQCPSVCFLRGDGAFATDVDKIKLSSVVVW